MKQHTGPWRGRRAWGALAVAVSLATLATPALADDSQEASALAEDGLYVRVQTERGEPANSVYVSAVVDAPAAALWSAVDDMGGYARFLPLYRETHAEPEIGEVRRLDYVLGTPWPFFDIAGVARVAHAAPTSVALTAGAAERPTLGRADFVVLEGSMKDVRGSVWVEPYEGGRSRVSFLYLSSREGLFPAFLTRWAVSLMVPETLEHFTAEAKRRAERPALVAQPVAPPLATPVSFTPPGK